MVTMYMCALNTYFILFDCDTGFKVIDSHSSVFTYCNQIRFGYFSYLVSFNVHCTKFRVQMPFKLDVCIKMFFFHKLLNKNCHKNNESN